MKRTHLFADTYPGAAIIGVYISEAHASDEWPLGRLESVPQHKTKEERLGAAKNFVTKYEWKLPMLVDGMKDIFARQYGAWPERFFIVGADRKVAHLAMPTLEFGFDRADIASWLLHNGMNVPAASESKAEPEEDADTLTAAPPSKGSSQVVGSADEEVRAQKVGSAELSPGAT